MFCRALGSCLPAAALVACGVPSSSGHHGRAAPSIDESFGALWDDASRCEAAIGQGERWTRASGVLRIVSWNLHWFPDGGPGNDAAPTGSGTDVDWAACVLAGLDADVVALQEIKTTEPGKAALAALAARLGEHTEARWAWAVDECHIPSWQHVALLYRGDRVEVQEIATHPELDPTADGKPSKDGKVCLGQLRPGLGAYVRSRRGGLDFHLVDVHLDSGRKDRDYEHRQGAWERFAALATARQRLVDDPDVVILGDFNTMGCPSCGAPKADDEITALAQTVAAQPVPWRSLPPKPRCSEYYRGKGQPIDHAVVSRAMREAERAELRAAGVCERAACRDVSEELPIFRRLSDHCPLVLDLRDVDDD